MAATGNLSGNVKINTDSLNEVIVFSNRYRQEVDRAADEIKMICGQMEDDASLKGGDGDLIRENFRTIAIACDGLRESTEKISAVLNDKLVKAIAQTKGMNAAASTEAINKAARKAGTLKK